MPDAKALLFVALGVVGLVFLAAWIRAARRAKERGAPGPLEIAIGFVTNFFDTLGIGSFAPTTSIFKLKRLVPDERIPGTLNVGHALPT
ncbi:MAG: permease, partial [Thermoanaerobaculia bacterium]